jgi:hypothetical protein
MSNVVIDREIDLDEGKTVSVEIDIAGLYEPRYGADADGKRGDGIWLVDSHTYTVNSEEELTDDETAELEEKIEELVYDGDWDFEAASEREYETEDEL